MLSRWVILGFTPDAVVGAWQDSRLASACASARSVAGGGDEFRILCRGGDGEHLILWYVSPGAAAVLDRQAVAWREFQIGECDAPPENAGELLPATAA